MKCCITGWYGSETLGDRAIFDGILFILSRIDKNLEIKLSSLNPFYTERCLLEDLSFYKRHFNSLTINVFDAYDKKTLHRSISQSDILIMGGGPIMGILNLYLIQHAFRYAKRLHKKTIIFGCGFGPIRKKEFEKVALNIFKKSDLIIMRSSNCKEKVEKLLRKQKTVFNAVDPAIISVFCYKKSYFELQKNSHSTNEVYSLMNLRDLDIVYETGKSFYDNCLSIVRFFSQKMPNLCLYPMHTFFVGGDDRIIENRISLELKKEGIDVKVIQKPLSLEQSYKLIINSRACVGVRYHSVVFQTFLNGNNYIVDYADPNSGKTISFLKDIDLNGFYKNRYLNMLDYDSEKLDSILFKDSFFSFDSSNIESDIIFYVKTIKDLLQNDN